MAQKIANKKKRNPQDATVKRNINPVNRRVTELEREIHSTVKTIADNIVMLEKRLSVLETFVKVESVVIDQREQPKNYSI